MVSLLCFNAIVSHSMLLDSGSMALFISLLLNYFIVAVSSVFVNFCLFSCFFWFASEESLYDYLLLETLRAYDLRCFT